MTQIILFALIILFVLSLYWGLHHSGRKKAILKIISSFNRGQEQIYSLAELSKYILSFFMNYSGSQKGALFIYYRQGNELRLGGSVGIDETENFPPLITGSETLTWLLQLKKLVVPIVELSQPLFEEAFPSLRERLQKETFTYLIPFVERNTLFGFIALGGGTKKLHSDILDPLLAVAHHALESLYLYESAVTDETTGLFNKRFFRQTLSAELRRSDRYRQPCSLLAFDLDDFKRINDVYGHPQGDRVLKELSEKVRDCIREGIDIAARTGGEEFHVVLPATDSERARIVAERIRAAARDHVFGGLKEGQHVTLSLGIATYPTHADDETKLVLLADQSLYLAKGKGKDRVCVAAELNDQVLPRHEESLAEQVKLFDPQTLLYRADYFTMRLKEEIKRSVRYQFPCSLLILGIEASKVGSGFDTMRKFSPVLRESLRIGIDTPAALDRERVGIIVPEIERKRAAVLAKRLQSMAQGFTLSAGVVAFPDDALTEDALIGRGFEALKEAQSAGAGQIVVWGEVPAES